MKEIAPEAEQLLSAWSRRLRVDGILDSLLEERELSYRFFAEGGCCQIRAAPRKGDYLRCGLAAQNRDFEHLFHSLRQRHWKAAVYIAFTCFTRQASQGRHASSS
jgi:hypothetical protein